MMRVQVDLPGRVSADLAAEFVTLAGSNRAAAIFGDAGFGGIVRE